MIPKNLLFTFCHIIQQAYFLAMEKSDSLETSHPLSPAFNWHPGPNSRLTVLRSSRYNGKRHVEEGTVFLTEKLRNVPAYRKPRDFHAQINDMQVKENSSLKTLTLRGASIKIQVEVNLSWDRQGFSKHKNNKKIIEKNNFYI